MLSKMKRKLMICAMALCICAGLTGNTGEVSVWASEGSSSDAVRIGALKGPTAMGMAQLLDEDGYDFTIAASPDEIVPMIYLYIHISSPPVTDLINNAFKSIAIYQFLIS